MTTKLAAYEIKEDTEHTEKHTIAVLVDNEFGVLSRVIGLFSSRGYNIESLTVSEIDEDKHLSRITIITRASQAIITQIMALLERLVPVHQVRDLSTESPHIERGVALVKIVGDETHLMEAQRIANRFGARTIDSTPQSFIFELSDTPENLDNFVNRLRPLGMKEVCRTGVTAISRGAEGMEY